MVDKDDAKLALKSLIDSYNRKFKNNNENSRNEKQVCESLIKPFIHEVLGWDIKDPDEFRVEYPQGGKRIDYLIQINGISQFVIEAKAITKDIIDNHEFYQQTIGYAHGKERAFAILTNFKDFIILDCSADVENPLQAESKRIKIEDLINDDKFDTIWNFSKEKWQEQGEENNPLFLKSKKRRNPIDAELLVDMRRWRDGLRKNLKHNKTNSFINWKDEDSLNYLEEEIQRFVDRLVFICFCEDKQLVDNKLKPYLNEKKDEKYFGKSYLLPKIKELFLEYRKNYNSDLFEKKGWCDNFIIDDSVLFEIIQDLRSPIKRIPYNFETIDEDILGKTYENFIGYLLYRSKEREDIGKRKKEGIYYTPKYVVDFIIKNTLKEYIKGKSFEDIKKIKVLDPACGSASFLRKAFDITVQESEKKLDRTLTYKERTDLFLDCIYGVDKDERACDIAKLSISLKVVYDKQLLPKLHDNIRNGDSIIDNKEIEPKAFLWEREFQNIIDDGGFDVIIGNPPYGAELNELDREYISKNYETAKSYKNTALIFIEKAMSLLKKDGYLGLIVPKSIAYSQAWKPCRDFIIKDLLLVVDVSKAFEDVLLEQVIFIVKKGSNNKNYKVHNLKNNNNFNVNKEFVIKTDSLIVHDSKEDFEIFKKIISLKFQLKDISKTTRGLPFQKIVSKDKSNYKIFRGVHISRYHLDDSKDYLKNLDINNSKVKLLLQQKIISQRIVAHVTKPKDHIIIMSMLDNSGVLTLDTIENTILTNKDYKLETILAILNSNLISWYAYRYIFGKAIRTMDFDDYYVGKIAIPKINQKIQLKLQKLVETITNLTNKHSILTENNFEKNRLKRQIDQTNYEIDQLVYELYGITKEEQKIIEDSLKN